MDNKESLPTFQTFLEYNIDFSSGDPTDRAAAIEKARKLSRMQPEQVKQLEKREARERQQQTRQEANPQVRTLRRKKDNLLKQLAAVQEQIKAAEAGK